MNTKKSVTKLGYVTEKILKATQIVAIAWASLIALIYLSILTDVLYALPFAIREICVGVLYFGIWGGPVLAVITVLELLILKLRAKSLANINKRLTIAAIIVPPLFTMLICLYEFGVGEVLS